MPRVFQMVFHVSPKWCCTHSDMAFLVFPTWSSVPSGVPSASLIEFQAFSKWRSTCYPNGNPRVSQMVLNALRKGSSTLLTKWCYARFANGFPRVFQTKKHVSKMGTTCLLNCVPRVSQRKWLTFRTGVPRGSHVVFHEFPNPCSKRFPN